MTVERLDIVRAIEQSFALLEEAESVGASDYCAGFVDGALNAYWKAGLISWDRYQTFLARRTPPRGPKREGELNHD